MTTRRDALKALLDEVPESCLDTVEGTVRHLIKQNLSEEHFHIRPKESGISSNGWSGYENDCRFGGQSFRNFDKGTLEIRTLQFLGSHEIEVHERLSLSPDRTKLTFSLSITSGGHTVQHEDEFPAIAEKSVE